MTNSLTYLGEQYVLELLRSHDELRQKKIVHHDEDAPGEMNCLCVSGAEGNKRLEGPMGYAVDVTIEFRTTEPKIAADNAARAMRESIQSAPLLPVNSLRQMQGLWIFDDEMSQTRGDTDHLRIRTMTIPLLIVPAGSIPIDEEDEEEIEGVMLGTGIEGEVLGTGDGNILGV